MQHGMNQVEIPEAVSNECERSPGPESIDFTKPTVRTTQNPTSPLVVSIDDSAANRLTPDAYSKISKQLGIYTRTLLAEASHISTSDQHGYPFGPISGTHINRAVPLANKHLSNGVERAERLTKKIQELCLAVFAAALGMFLDHTLGRIGTSGEVEETTMALLFILSGLIFALTRP